MAAPRTSPSAPARGTRPANRRTLIVDAAAALFSHEGYSQVSMSDIADAVAVSPSALYRHFPSKHDLLAAVLRDRIGALQQRLADGTDLAAAAAADRQLGVLWQREARHLDAPQRAGIEAEIDTVIAVITRALDRPELDADQTELTVWCQVGVLASPAFHHVQLPGDGLAEVLRGMLASVRALDLSHVEDTSAGTAAGLTPVDAQSRREQLLTAAIERFAQRGYQAVGIEEIGAAAGVVGTNIYRYYATKADMLLAAMTRGGEWLRLDLNRTLAEASTPADGLRGLVRSYARFTCEHSDMIDVLVSETPHLPAPDRDRIRQTQRDYIAEWVHLAALVSPADGPDVARVRVQAVLTVINTVARNTRLRSLPYVQDALTTAGRALLQV